VRRVGFGSGVQAPLRIEPQRMEVEKDVLESGGDETRNVLQEANRSAAVSDDASDFWPEPAGVSSAGSLACDGDGLAWESRNDQIHRSAPASSVEGEQVAPHRSVIQTVFAHVLDQNRGGLDIPFHVADRDSAWAGESDSEVESAIAGAERQDSGMCNHTQDPFARGSATIERSAATSSGAITSSTTVEPGSSYGP
jgi:hypothetical protein